MAGSFTLPTVLANLTAGNQPLSLIDGDLNALANPLLALGTFGNYYTDTGAANAYAITVSAPQTVALAAGLPVQVKATNANTGASTLQINALAAKNILSPNGLALRAGMIPAGGLITVMYDGTQFVLLGISGFENVVLAKSGAAVSLPVDTTEDTVATITIPANSMGANGRIRVTTYWTETNNANSKTTRIKFGGTNFASIASANLAQRGTLATISNRNATNSQWGVGTFTGVGSYNDQGYITAAIDTTSAVTMLITGQKATAGDTLTLESYLVELLSNGA